jgi:hypothetical protein
MTFECASQVALARGVYNERVCKLCKDGVVVMGEYGLSISLMAAGYSFDTLMYKYGGVDWADERNWKCNNQVHILPSIIQANKIEMAPGTF